MTKEKAYKVAQALNDIDDFEIFMDEIDGVYQNLEGNFTDFYENELMPLLRAELANRKAILESL